MHWSLFFIVISFLSLISIFYFDQKIALYFDKKFGSSLDQASNWITWIGLGDQYFAVSIFGFFFSLILEKFFLKENHTIKKTKRFFLSLFYFLFFSGIILLALKALFGRCRPYMCENFNALDFRPFNLHHDFQSFPSGHTQVSFTVATFLSLAFPRHWYWFYLLSILVAFSRITLDYHFLADTLFGSFVGIGGAMLVNRFYPPRSMASMGKSG